MLKPITILAQNKAFHRFVLYYVLDLLFVELETFREV